MLRKHTFAFYFLCLFLLIPLFLGSMGFLFFSFSGFRIGILVGILAQFVLMMFLDRLLIWLFRAERFCGERVIGMSQIEIRGQLKRLRVYIIPDVRPEFYWIRPLFSVQGSVFVTQGLVSQINGVELESLFQASLKKFDENQGYVRALFRTLYVLTHRLCIRDEARLLDEGTQGVYKLILLIKLWVFFPLNSMFRKSLGLDDLECLGSDDPNVVQVRLKLNRLNVIWRQV